MSSANDMTQVVPQAVDYFRVMPEIVLAVFGMIVMLLDPFLDQRRNQKNYPLIDGHGYPTVCSMIFPSFLFFRITFFDP